MGIEDIGPGEDIEAWCTKCRMNLDHRVIAMVGREVKKVKCLTCNGDHKYYPPKIEKSDEKPKRGRSARSTTVSDNQKSRGAARSAASALGEWTAMMRDLPETYIPRKYATVEYFVSDEFIEHAIFGVGKVLDIVGQDKMSVIFKDGRKILLFNKK